MLKHFNYKIETVSSVQLSLFEIKARIVNCLSLKALYYVSLRKFERVAFFSYQKLLMLFSILNFIHFVYSLVTYWIRVVYILVFCSCFVSQSGKSTPLLGLLCIWQCTGCPKKSYLQDNAGVMVHHSFKYQ